MAETDGAAKVSAPSRPPTIALPRRSSFETLFAGGAGLSPGPMTLVSNFFSEQYPDADFHSFSQLLAGAMASPGAPSTNPFADNNSSKETNSGDEIEKYLGFKQNRPMNLVIANSPTFMIPSGLSPSGLLNSPGFFSPQSPFGMSHQQALAHVTAQAALSQSYYNIQAEYRPSTLEASPESPEQQMPTITSDQEGSQIESSEVSHSDKKPLPVDKPANDCYNWRKYGQKQVKASEYPRSYYKCTHINCPVKKKVGSSLDGRISDIIYKGQHNHEPPQQNKRAKEGSDMGKTRKSQARPELGSRCQSETHRLEEVVASQLAAGNNQVSAELIDLEETDDATIGPREGGDDQPNPKRRNTEVGLSELALSHKTVAEPKIIVQTRSEIDLLDDGYKWRKYGQKVVKGNTHPRSYYKCTYSGCNVRKHVERASTDPKAVVTTYEGKHNHDIPTARNRNYNIANTDGLQPKREKEATAKPARHKEMNFGKDQRSVLLQLKEEQITA